MLENIAKLLNSKDKLLTEIYFDLQLLFEEKYGKNTIVFMEIGSFFETYEVNNQTHQIGKTKMAQKRIKPTPLTRFLTFYKPIKPAKLS